MTTDYTDFAAGATASDHGHPTATTADLPPGHAEARFARVRQGSPEPADAELFRLEAIVRWLDAADVRLKQRPHLAPPAAAEVPVEPTHPMEVPQ